MSAYAPLMLLPKNKKNSKIKFMLNSDLIFLYEISF